MYSWGPFSALHVAPVYLINYKRTSRNLIYWNLKLLIRIQGYSQASSQFLWCGFNSGGVNAFFFHEVQNDDAWGHNRKGNGWLSTLWRNLHVFKCIHSYWFHSCDCFLNVFQVGHEFIFSLWKLVSDWC